jgi:ubiquitin C-terminal hydrolase
VWRDIITISQAQANRVRMDSGQQDAHEGLMMFLDAMETIPELHRLFQHRHTIETICSECKHSSPKKAFNLVFVACPTLTTHRDEKFKDADEYYKTSMPMNEFLRKQNGVVEDFICPNVNCKSRSPKLQTTTLSMIPEIIPVVLKKYYEKTPTPFPAKLEFLARGGAKKYVYKLVAQSEHAGGMSGGHYWATGLRSDGWKSLNDGGVGAINPGPTNNTYIIFYHFTGEEVVNTKEFKTTTKTDVTNVTNVTDGQMIPATASDLSATVSTATDLSTALDPNAPFEITLPVLDVPPV